MLADGGRPNNLTSPHLTLHGNWFRRSGEGFRQAKNKNCRYERSPRGFPTPCSSFMQMPHDCRTRKQKDVNTHVAQGNWMATAPTDTSMKREGKIIIAGPPGLSNSGKRTPKSGGSIERNLVRPPDVTPTPNFRKSEACIFGISEMRGSGKVIIRLGSSVKKTATFDPKKFS